MLVINSITKGAKEQDYNKSNKKEAIWQLCVRDDLDCALDTYIYILLLFL